MVDRLPLGDLLATIDSMKTLKNVNPYSGQVIAAYPVESISQVGHKITRLRKAQVEWGALSVGERVGLVRDGLAYFNENRERIAADISAQMGRPLSQAPGELNGLFERAEYLLTIAEQTLATEIIEQSDAFYRGIEHVPLGTIFVISPWNYPLLVTVNSVVPALLAGNTVLLKHSSLTPGIGAHFENAFCRLGELVPLLQHIVVDHDTTGRIIEELPIDHVVFTGSVGGGRQILNHCAKKFITPQLELGGKDGALVARDADLDLAAETLVDGAMFNSGQSCCGIERVYVDESVAQPFIEKCETLLQGYRPGDPAVAETNLGPLARPQSAELMLAQIADAVAKGAKILTGGQAFTQACGRFLQPTLIVDVDETMAVMREENFGPIMPVQTVAGVEEGIRRINDSDYGLTSVIFTNDEALAQRFARRMETGTVFVNRCDYLDPALPWTGVKNSGCGSALSRYGFYGVTRRKAVHHKKSR